MNSMVSDDLKTQAVAEEKPQSKVTKESVEIRQDPKPPAAVGLQTVSEVQEKRQPSAGKLQLAAQTREKLQLVSSVMSSSTFEASLATHEGQMRWLKDKGKNFSLPAAILSPKAMAGDFEPGEGAKVLDKGFPWHTNEFEEGSEENAVLLAEIEKNFSAMTGTKKPEWEGLEMALDDPENLRAALDLAVCYMKNHQLDKCEILLGRYAVPASMARGMPWIVKALQDYATLRMKQRRNAESMVMLEKLESMVPAHPIMLHNIGLAYNSMRMHDKAMEKFEQAVALRDGKMDFDDYWQIGITHMHKGEYNVALGNLSKALALAEIDPLQDFVTLGKLNCNVASCLASALYDLPADQKDKKLELAQKAEPFIRSALELYNTSTGRSSLYGMAAHDMGKNLRDQGRFLEAEPFFYDAIDIEANRDAVHPTLCWHMVSELMEVYNGGGVPEDRLPKYHDLLRTMLMNLHMRGFLKDGNGGVVMHKIAEFLMLSGAELSRPVLALLRQALTLVENHKDDVQDTKVMQMVMKMEMEQMKALAMPSGSANSRAPKSESWLLEGPLGAPDEGSIPALGVDIR